MYVGEGDCIADRIKKHSRDADKEFWERVCLVTSKDVNLTKAHVRYLENRLVQIIVDGGRARVANGNAPPSGTLPEADLSDMEFFVSQLQILLPTVGLDFLRPKPNLELSTYALNADGIPFGGIVGAGNRLTLTLKHKGVEGHAIEDDGEIVVLKGSIGSGKQNAQNSYAHLRKSLISEGKIELREDSSILFLDDVAFASPSAAAAVLNNRNSAGPNEWVVDATGQTLKVWRELQLEQSPVTLIGGDGQTFDGDR